MLSLIISTLLFFGAEAAPVPAPDPQFPGLPGGTSTTNPFGGGFPTTFPIPTSFPIPSGGSGGFPGFPGFPGSGGGALPTGLPTGGFGGFGGGAGGGALPSGLPTGGFGGFGGGAGSSTSNDLVNGACKQVTFIFARGTSEAGNMGSVVGPPLADALKSAFGDDNVAVQGVDYAADASGAVTGSISPGQADGAKKMTQLAQQAASSCPTSKVVLSGYSQGAQQVHGALQDLGAGNKVAAAVTFGDPLSSQPFQNINASQTKVFCADGDAVCNGTFNITPAHLSYGSDANDAASFVKQALGS